MSRSSSWMVVMAVATAGCATPSGSAHKGAAKTPGVANAAAPRPAAVPAAVDVQVPAGWRRQESAAGLMITGPDPALRVVVSGRAEIVELSVKERLAQAIRLAWKSASPRFDAMPKHVIDVPVPAEPYDKTVIADYEVGSSQIVRQGLAHRYAGKTYVILLEGPLSEVKKRSAQLREVVGSVRPIGAKRTTLGAKDAVTLTPAHMQQLRALVERARVELDVPGVSLVVAQRGRVLLSMGAGVLEVGSDKKVTPRTHMMIGSITKSFTGLMLARLVADGKLAWETPVSQIDPAFRLKSAEQTASIKLEHLMCACTGVPRRDMPIIFEWEKASPESVMRDLHDYELLTGFGETFQYSNQLVAAAGFVAAKAAGRGRGLARRYRWLLRDRVLDPLGMKDTLVDFDAVMRLGRYATPHSETIEGKVTPVAVAHERFVLPYAPAGALWTTADDFGKLLVALTSAGRPGLAPAPQLAQLWRPRVKVAAEASYGLGWMSSKYKGTTMYSHGGGTLGFISYFGYLPQAELAFALLTNGSRGGAMRGVVTEALLSRTFGQPDESSKQLAFVSDLIKKKIKELKEQTEPRVDAKRLARLLGVYHQRELGRVRILEQGDRAVLDTGPLKMAFRPKKKAAHAETYVIAEPPLTGIEFWVEEQGGRPVLQLEPNSVRYTLQRR